MKRIENFLGQYQQNRAINVTELEAQALQMLKDKAQDIGEP